MEPRVGESGDSRGWTSQGAAQQVSGVLSGVKFRAGLERRGSRRTGEGFHVSRQVEGSQHAGIAEIMSGEASFVPQLFFDSERGESERKESGKQEDRPRFPWGHHPPSPSHHLLPGPGLSEGIPWLSCAVNQAVCKPIDQKQVFSGCLPFVLQAPGTGEEMVEKHSL